MGDRSPVPPVTSGIKDNFSRNKRGDTSPIEKETSSSSDVRCVYEREENGRESDATHDQTTH